MVTYSEVSPFVGPPSSGLSYAKVAGARETQPTRDLWCS